MENSEISRDTQPSSHVAMLDIWLRGSGTGDVNDDLVELLVDAAERACQSTMDTH